MSRDTTFETWRGRHRGATILVCGCGRSLAALAAKPPCPVIGVNDIGRRFDPDYLVVVNPRRQFPPERFAAIERSRARAVFTCIPNIGLSHPCVVRFRLGQRGGTSLTPEGTLPYTRNSPYIALALALYMGARRIGLIGVDFTDDHFFGATGTHPLAGEIDQMNREYGLLASAAARTGVKIVNLSAESRLAALPRVALSDFLDRRAPRHRVLHVARTNCAGAIWNLHQLMLADGRVESRVSTASEFTVGIGRPRRYPQDISWQDTEAMSAAIARADILHFHNFVDAQSPALARFAAAMCGKPAVLQVHTEPRLLARHFPGRNPQSRSDIPVLVVAQKQARFYPRATPVLNALDPAEFASFPGAGRPAPGPPRVVYTPTDLADYPAQPPTCRGKGYGRTRTILEQLGAARLIEPVIALDLDREESLALAHGASARIDECVTGGYHLTSLEALAQGLATFAWLDSETRALLAQMTGSDEAALPWVSVPLDGLEARLAAMARQPESFAAAGAAGRDWMARHWTAEAVLAPIFAAYDGITTTAAPLPARPARRSTTLGDVPTRRVHAAEGQPPSTCAAPDGSLSATLPGRPAPRRSEDFPQRIRLGAGLLDRAGTLVGGIAHILGNGPSLAKVDLARLKGDCVIGVNAAPLLQARLGRPFDAYCVSDRRFLATAEGLAMVQAARPSLRVFAGYCAGFVEDADIHYVRILPGDGASDDLRLGVYHGCSVALFAGQLAVWLGAGEVRLHGMECDYSIGRFDAPAGHAARPNDPGIYPRIVRNAEALAALLARRGGRLSVAGPSRLTGSFGATPVPGITPLPIAGCAVE